MAGGARHLDPGDLLFAADGRPVRVAGLRAGPGSTQAAYNLTVDDIHTYYVLAGDTPVLVHNSCPGINDDHIVNNHTPEGMYSTDASKTERLPETTKASRAALINDVLKRGHEVKDTRNRDGIVKEFTYEEPVGYTRDRNRTPLYTLRVYYDPDTNYVSNAFPVKR